MNRNLPSRPPRADLRERIAGMLDVTRNLVVPGAGATALYLLVPGQWQAFKALLATWGIPAAWGVALAPLVLGGAIMGARWALRTFQDVDASPDS